MTAEEYTIQTMMEQLVKAGFAAKFENGRIITGIKQMEIRCPETLGKQTSQGFVASMIVELFVGDNLETIIGDNTPGDGKNPKEATEDAVANWIQVVLRRFA